VKYTLNHITVTSSYREAVRQLYPNIDKQKGYWELFQHLQFGTWRDEVTGEIIIPARLCGVMEQKDWDCNYSARKFLTSFSEDVAQVEWRDHVYNFTHDAKARRVVRVQWDERIVALTHREKRTYLPGDRVWLSTGKKYRREDEIEIRRHTQMSALASMDAAGCREAFELLAYLNNLAPNRFSAIKKHLRAAMAVAETTKDADRQHNILKAIESQAQPFYEQGDKTSRVFAINDSFLRLHRDVRQVMTQDWVSADLRSAQLSIVAKLWNVPDLTKFLLSGRSIWAELSEWMGVQITAENKAVLKNFLYALIFGAGETTLNVQLAERFGDGKAALQRLLSHPVMQAMMRARRKQIRKTKTDGGGYDAFGTWYQLQFRQVEGKPYKFDNTRSIMAIQAQSFELKLLYPVLQMAKENPDAFSLTMWLHDGFCFDVRKERDKAMWVKRMQQAVSEEAARLGISTELEVTL
jgi:hypothetical protein